MSTDHGARGMERAGATALLYHFCRLQHPAIDLSAAVLERHLQRTFEIYRAKAGASSCWETYLDELYPLDWFVASACLERCEAAWESLFAARANRADCLLVDALRARAVRLYPRDQERQESAVAEFWSQLLVSEKESRPILARYDGQRPLVPWLIRVFQNLHISQLRSHSGIQALPEDDLAMSMPADANGHWHEAFRLAAGECLRNLADNEILILGMRLRYHMSQREVAQLLGVHEGTISRQTTQLRDRCLEHIGRRLLDQGWTGEDVSGFILNEMGSVLMDDPRLSADRLAALLANRGKKLPRPKDDGGNCDVSDSIS